MDCATCRELLSAELDGEATHDERTDLAEHVAACGGCSAYRRRLAGLHRSVRVREAEPVPDLTAAIVAAHTGARPRRGARRRPAAPRQRVTAARYVLLGVALTQLILALPELVARGAGAEPVHVARHLGAWDVAFAVGLLVVAWQPDRARGLLPMAAALGGVMVVTAGLDVVGGSVGAVAETTHLLELAGLGLVWWLARQHPPLAPPARTGGPESPAWAPGAATVRPDLRGRLGGGATARRRAA